MNYSLPTTVTVKDKEFHIRNNGDFRMVLDCFGALNDEEMGEDLRVLASLLIFYDEMNDLEDTTTYQEYLQGLVSGMFDFFNCGQVDNVGSVTTVSLVDWDKDAQIICAAINTVANKEIRAMENLHWWTFIGYYMSIGESLFSNVVNIRDKVAHNKKLEKWEKEFKQKNPDYFNWRSQDSTAKELEDTLKKLWNHGGDS